MSRRGLLVVAVVLLAIPTLGLYAPSLDGWFLADDFMYVGFASKHVEAGDWGPVLAFFHRKIPENANPRFYRPLLVLSFAIDGWLWRLNATGYHLTNLLLHLGTLFVATALLFRFTDRWGITLGAMLLWCLYPTHAEVVIWLVGRVDSLAAFFSLLAVLLFLIELDRGSSSVVLRGAAFVSLAAGLCSKETAVFAVPLLTVMAWLRLRERWKVSLGRYTIEVFKETAPFWVLALAYLGVRYLLLGTLVGGYANLPSRSPTSWLFWEDKWRIAQVLLAPLKGLDFPNALRWIVGLGTAILLLIGTASSLRTRENRVIASLGIAWFLISLVPVYNLPISPQDFKGARFFYLPAVPFSLLIVTSCDSIRRWLATRPSVKPLSLAPVAFGAMLAAFYGWSLHAHIQSWEQAAGIARTVREQAHAAIFEGRPEKLVLTGLPTDHRGAFLFPVLNHSYMLEEPFTPSDKPRQVASFSDAQERPLQKLLLSAVAEQQQLDIRRWDPRSSRFRPIRFERIGPVGFGDGTVLLAGTWPAIVRVGETARARLLWKAPPSGAVPPLTLELLAPSGEIVASSGRTELSTRLGPGLVSVHSLELPEGLSPGDYALVVASEILSEKTVSVGTVHVR